MSARVSLSVGAVNEGSFGDFWWSANASSIYFLLDIASAGLDTLTDGDDVTYDVSVSYADVTIVKTVHYVYEVDAPLLDSNDMAVDVSDVTTDTGTNVGEVFTINLEIMTSGRSIADYAVEASVPEDSPLASESINIT